VGEIGGVDPESGTAAMHDFFLRASAAGVTFEHLALTLLERPFAQRFEGAPRSDDLVAMLEREWGRRGRTGHAAAGPVPGTLTWSLAALEPLPRVEIVIPTRDRLDLVRACLASLESLTTYPNYSITILDNDSALPETLEFFASSPYKVVPCPGEFNYASIMNRGIAAATGEFVVTLNNDTKILTPDWLEKMVAVAQLPEVGIVGNHQIDPDHGTVHAGVVLAQVPEHVRFADESQYDFQVGRWSRDVVAVTGACTIMRRQLWNELGGMDERLRVTFNDVDLCLRSHARGFYNVYLDDVLVEHREEFFTWFAQPSRRHHEAVRDVGRLRRFS
jgi:GT2 family glycosyltransferase